MMLNHDLILEFSEWTRQFQLLHIRFKRLLFLWSVKIIAFDNDFFLLIY